MMRKIIAFAASFLLTLTAAAQISVTLWNGQQVMPPTVITPDGGMFSGATSATVTESQAGALIWVTTSGKAPGPSEPSSTSCTSPCVVPIPQTLPLRTIALESGFTSLLETDANFIITIPPTGTPQFSLAAGTYTTPPNVVASDLTPLSTLYCTQDGSTPTTGSPSYANPHTFVLSTVGPTNLQCVADAPGYTVSSVFGAIFTYKPAAANPALSPTPPATYGGSVPGGVSITDATGGAVINYTVTAGTTGTTPTAASPIYSTAIPISATSTVCAIASATLYGYSAVVCGTYTITTSGSLALTTPAALPLATIGTSFSYTMTATGGTPPYTWTLLNYSSDQKAANGTYVAPTPQNVWSLASSTGILTASPAGAESDYFLIKVADAAGASITRYFATTVGSSTNRLIFTNPISLGNFTQGTVYNSGSPLVALNAVGGISSLTYSLTSQTGTNTWAVSSAGLVTGTATNAETDTITVQVTDGTNITTQTYALTVNPCVTGCARPSYNSGGGLFVLNGEIYDANGQLFRPRGVDRSHFDDSPTGYAAFGANIVRYTLWYGTAETTQVTDLTAQHTAINQVVAVSRHYDHTGGTSSGSTNLGMQTGANASGLGTMVTDWVNNEAAYAPVMSKIIVNLANEWGPDTGHVGGGVIDYLHGYQYVSCPGSATAVHTWTCSTVSGTNPFANSLGLTIAYLQGAPGNTDGIIAITAVGGSSGAWTVTTTATLTTGTGGNLYGGAVGVMRAAGFTAPLMIDAGQYGQGYTSLTNYSAAIFNSDPQKNIIFDYHIYGGTTTLGTLTAGLSAWATLRSANGMAFMAGEFGPNGYPTCGTCSPTVLPTQQILGALEDYGMGYAAWAVDNYTTYSGTSSKSDDNQFTMKYADVDNGNPSNRTQFGKYLLNDPIYGVIANARLATGLGTPTKTVYFLQPTLSGAAGNFYANTNNGVPHGIWMLDTSEAPQCKTPTSSDPSGAYPTTYNPVALTGLSTTAGNLSYQSGSSTSPCTGSQIGASIVQAIGGKIGAYITTVDVPVKDPAAKLGDFGEVWFGTAAGTPTVCGAGAATWPCINPYATYNTIDIGFYLEVPASSTCTGGGCDTYVESVMSLVDPNGNKIAIEASAFHYGLAPATKCSNPVFDLNGGSGSLELKCPIITGILNPLNSSKPSYITVESDSNQQLTATWATYKYFHFIVTKAEFQQGLNDAVTFIGYCVPPNTTNCVPTNFDLNPNDWTAQHYHIQPEEHYSTQNTFMGWSSYGNEIQFYNQ